MALKFLPNGAAERRLMKPDYRHATAVPDRAARVRNLTKSYASSIAVDGIDFDIQAGEIFSLLGPNGAGKTTVVEILEGHRTRDGGEVEVLGADPGTAPRSWYNQIGIVLQESSDAPELTVREVVRHYASYYTNRGDPDEIIQNVGLKDNANRRVHQLSGGQRRRLDVALGIVGRPKLLFLDEPTTGFDPEARRDFWTLVRGLAGEGTAILLTTHYLDEAEALADRVAVLLNGRIAVSGKPATLGGRASANARVSWVDSTGRRTVHTQTPEQVVGELARQAGDVISELTVTRPSLEDVYLDLIRKYANDGETP
jgi:ABC-2 type transport system ATP-binding protein